MSREQWGHGYHKGKTDAIKGTGLPKWILMYDAQDKERLKFIGWIHERHGKTLTVEMIDPMEFDYCAITGKSMDCESSPIIWKNVEEFDPEDYIGCFEFAYSFATVLREHIRARELYRCER